MPPPPGYKIGSRRAQGKKGERSGLYGMDYTPPKLGVIDQFTESLPGIVYVRAKTFLGLKTSSRSSANVWYLSILS